jgi:FkbM family methyltransferase
MKLRTLSKAVALGVVPGAVTELRKRNAELRRIGVAADAMASARWEPHLWSSRLTLLPEGELTRIRTVVDVGCHVGDWTATVLKLAVPEQVIAIEADPHVAEGVRKRFASDERVTVLPTAVGNQPGVVEFNVGTSTRTSSVLKPTADTTSELDGFATSRKVEVPLTTLDQALSEVHDVSLLKLDVQGYELQVLRGAESVLGRTKWVLIEVNFLQKYHGQAMFDDVHQALREAGFALVGMSAPEFRRGVPSYADALYHNRRA